MYSALLRALNIEKRESTMVWLMVFQSFFIGVFFATLENSATTLFMTAYGEELLGRAFLVSGLMGMVLTGIFSGLQGRIKYSTLITLNSLLITILTFGMWASFNYTNNEWLVFGIFSLMGALYILSLVAFSGMAGRMFTLRQGKRLFSIIDSGLVFGMIIISLAIPFILQIFTDIKDLMLISAVSIFISFIFQTVITSKYNVNSEGNEDDDQEQETASVGLGAFLKNRYIRLLALFVMISMIALFFTAYNFLTVGKINYPEEIEFAKFFANFTIAVMGFSFILKTFVYSKLLKTYGLQVSLMVAPVLIGLFVLVSAAVGTIFGYDIEEASFVIFFLLLSLVRFFAINLKDSIQTPSLRLLFQPIDARIRYNIQAKVEGLVNEFSAVFSGLILLVFGMLPFMELINYSHVLVLICAAWIYITVQLYKEYQNMLRKSLVDYKRQQKTETDQGSESEVSDDSLSIERIQRSLNILKNYEPTMFSMKLDQLLRENSIKAKEVAIKSIDEAEIFASIKELGKIAKEDSNPTVKKMADEVKKKLEKSFKSLLDDEKLIALARSKNEDDRAKAAKIIGESENFNYASLLKNLMKDLSPKVKLQAINAVVQLNNRDLWPALIDQLGEEQYRSAARTALISIGEEVLENLEKAFYKSGAHPELLLTVVELYGKIGGEKAVKYLLKKLNDPNQQIVRRALYSLKHLSFSADNENIRSQIYQALEQNVGLAAWNLAAKFDVDSQRMNPYLSKALDREIEDNYDMIFMLLSLIYDPQSIQQIRENIESGTTEGVSFAIEMLDLFIADQLKGFLFALLEDNRAEEKIRELELHFPINVYGNKDVLKQIMNRSANFLTNFTRACAVYSFLELAEEEQEISNDIVANLFNTDPLLSETAAVVMNKIDKTSYDLAKERLSENRQIELDSAISEFGKNKYAALIEKVIFLNEIKELKHQNPNLLEDLGLHLVFARGKAGDTLLKNGETNPSIFMLSGQANAQVKGLNKTFEENRMISDMFFLDSDGESAKITAEGEISYLKLSHENFQTLLFKYPELGDLMLFCLDERIAQNAKAA